MHNELLKLFYCLLCAAMNKLFSTDQSNKDSQIVMNYGRSEVQESQTLNVQVYVVTLQKLYR